MATQKEKVQQVIGILKNVNKQISELLKDSPELVIHSNSVLKRLCNGYAHAAGLPIDIDDEISEVKEPHVPLTHIAGIPVLQKEVIKPEAAIPSNEEEDDLKEFVDMAFDDFAAGHEPDSLKASYEDIIIRGVAIKAGMTDITPTNPADITVEFIESVQQFIKDNPAS